MKRGDYITCPTCKGKGKVFDHVVGIMTLGFAYMLALESFSIVRRIVYAIVFSGWGVATAVILYHFLFSK